MHRRIAAISQYHSDTYCLAVAAVAVLAIFGLYLSTGIDISSTKPEHYPFGADVFLYTGGDSLVNRWNIFSGNSYHWLVMAVLQVYKGVMGFLGFSETRLVIKLPYAVFGALNVAVSIAAFALVSGKLSIRSVIYGFCCGLTFIVWFYSSAPESYILSTLLYSTYFLIFIHMALHGVTINRGIALAIVFFLALANDLSALTLVITPLFYYHLEIVRDPALRRIFWLHVAAFAGYALLHHFFVGSLWIYFNLFKEYSPLRRNIPYNASFYEPFLSYFFHSIGAPESHTTHAPWKLFPEYKGYFSPSPLTYLSSAGSILFVAVYIWILSFLRISRIDKLALALSAFVVGRFIITAAFNPVETILYASVAVLPLFIVLFQNIEKSQFSYKATLATLFAASLFVTNLKFMT